MERVDRVSLPSCKDLYFELFELLVAPCIRLLMAGEEEDDDAFFGRLQDNLMVTYSKSKVLGANTFLGGDCILSSSQRNSLFQRLYEDRHSSLGSLTLTDLNPIFNILARGA